MRKAGKSACMWEVALQHEHHPIEKRRTIALSEQQARRYGCMSYKKEHGLSSGACVMVVGVRRLSRSPRRRADDTNLIPAMPHQQQSSFPFGSTPDYD